MSRCFHCGAGLDSEDSEFCDDTQACRERAEDNEDRLAEIEAHDREVEEMAIEDEAARVFDFVHGAPS